MAKVHDKFVIELAEVIKGYGNDPDVDDPFRLSEFYRFYELPEIAVSANHFKTMIPLEVVEKNAQPGWIPTSVKPPEPFKLVLIQDYCGCYELNTYIPPRINPKQYPNGYWGEVGNVDFDYFDVEAWCPLPAPYREGGQDGKN